MAARVYHPGLAKMLDGGIAYLTDTIKVMLVTASYSPDPDDQYVDLGGGTGPKAAELGVTGYARQTLASKTISSSNTANRVEIDAADVTFASLGAGATVAAVVVLKDAGGADTANRVISYLGVTPTPTNGGNVDLTFTTNGFLNITV